MPSDSDSTAPDFTTEEPRLLYWAFVEFTYEEGSDQHGIFEGGTVYAFLRAFDVREAVDKIEEEFEDRNLAVRAIDFVSEYRDIPWESEEDQMHFDGVSALAASTGDVFLDTFEVYERR